MLEIIKGILFTIGAVYYYGICLFFIVLIAMFFLKAIYDWYEYAKEKLSKKKEDNV